MIHKDPATLVTSEKSFMYGDDDDDDDALGATYQMWHDSQASHLSRPTFCVQRSISSQQVKLCRGVQYFQIDLLFSGLDIISKADQLSLCCFWAKSMSISELIHILHAVKGPLETSENHDFTVMMIDLPKVDQLSSCWVKPRSAVAKFSGGSLKIRRHLDYEPTYNTSGWEEHFIFDFALFANICLNIYIKAYICRTDFSYMISFQTSPFFGVTFRAKNISGRGG